LEVLLLVVVVVVTDEDVVLVSAVDDMPGYAVLRWWLVVDWSVERPFQLMSVLPRQKSET
jgi:hypothetical protein